MKFLSPAISLLLCGIIFCNMALCQTTGDDSVFIASAKANTQSLFLHSVGSQAAWMNGRANITYNFPFEGTSPFYGSSKFTEGTLTYDEVDYPGINLLYDEMSDKLISLTDKGRLELLSDHVDGFNIYERQFRRVSKDTVNRMVRGFYQVLYKGKSAVLAKNLKQIKEDLVSGTGIVRSIDTKTIYFFQKGRQYYYINSKKVLLNTLADKRDELQKFIKRNKLNWKRDTGRLITETVAYYDQLTK